MPAEVSGLAATLTNAVLDLATSIDLVGQAAAATLGINQTDLICLYLLMRHGPMSAGEVAEALGLTTAAISAMATRMEAGGYARREIDRKDRRRILLYAVQPAADQAIARFDGLYTSVARLCEEYREQDLRLLLDLVGRFTALVREQRTVLRTAK